MLITMVYQVNRNETKRGRVIGLLNNIERYFTQEITFKY
jgi:hypothetical protein